MLELLDFYAGWCGPCQTMKPVFEEVEKEFGDRIKFTRVDVDSDPALAEKYGVMSIPVFVLLKDGVEISRKRGVVPKEVLVTWLEESLGDQT